MTLLEIRSATITEKGQIAIPRGARDMKGFEIGTKIAVLAFEDRIELRPLKQIGKKMETALASERTLAKDWNTKEDDEAWKNL